MRKVDAEAPALVVRRPERSRTVQPSAQLATVRVTGAKVAEPHSYACGNAGLRP